MLIDGFLFNGEFEVLTLRLATLGAVVDRFVLVESARTFAGGEKPLHYAAHGRQLGAWRERIIHVVLDREPLGLDVYFAREGWQRTQIARGLEVMADNTRVLIGDVDEIPDPQALATATPICVFRQTLYYYNALTRCTSRHWLGTVLCTARDVRQHGAERIRQMRDSVPVMAGGWHFSHTGDLATIHDKLRAGSHREMDTSEHHAAAAERVAQGVDLFGRDEFHFERVSLASDLPAPLIRQPDRWPGLSTGRW